MGGLGDVQLRRLCCTCISLPVDSLGNIELGVERRHTL